MNELYNQIKEKIKNNNFLFILLSVIRANSIYLLNKISNNKLEKIRFYKHLRYHMNMKNPKSINEKIVWKKIHDRNPFLPVTTDKIQVRYYLEKILGKGTAKEILIPLLYVTDKPNTIPFASLPSAFIVKPNHKSGNRIIVENSYFDKNQIIKTCRRWLNTPYGLEKLEWAYQPIKRKIIIEKLLLNDDGNIPQELKFHMFYGKCKLVQMIINKKNQSYANFLDEKFNILKLRTPNHLTMESKIRRPNNYEIMMALVEKISKPFDYVRVDLYNLHEKIYFGELTHYPGSGTTHFEPTSFDHEFGIHWKIEADYWKKQ